jgi:hypothetical protein
LLPGYSAFLGKSDQVFVCILIFDWEDETQILGIGYHPALEDLVRTIETSLPSAHVKYHTSEPLGSLISWGEVIPAQPRQSPLMDLARQLASEFSRASNNSPTLKDRNRKRVAKAISEMP